MLKYIRDVLDKYFPVVVYKNVKNRAVWITSDLYEIMLQAFNKAILSKDDNDWIGATSMRNKVVDLCKMAKSEYLKN